MNEKLKADFPIEWEDDHFVTRREFFKFLTLASGGIAVGTGVLATFAKIPREGIKFAAARVCMIEDLQPGAALAFSYPRPADLCLLVRKRDGQFVAFTRRCTHLSCPVEYEVKKERELLYCPCHHGAFSLDDGSVIEGPPPRPLTQVKLEVRGQEVWATGVIKGERV